MKSAMKKCVLLPLALGLFSCAAQSAAPVGVEQSKNTTSFPELSRKNDTTGSTTVFAPALYILPSQFFPADDIAKAIDKLFAENDSGDNIILYVHGRSGGKLSEPVKSLKRIMPSLKDEYSAKVVMFFWPGSDEGGKFTFPEQRARAAAPALRTTLMQLQEYKKANAAKLKNTKITLILHSMGNIVFEELLRPYQPGTLDKGLFDTVVLSSSASASKGHVAWLRKMDFSPNLYVTVNNDDKILIGAGIKKRAARLGKEIKSKDGLAPNTTYVDVTDAKVNHAYFIPSGQEDSACLEGFYDKVMNGEPFQFESSNCVETAQHKHGTTIYRLKGD